MGTVRQPTRPGTGGGAAGWGAWGKAKRTFAQLELGVKAEGRNPKGGSRVADAIQQNPTDQLSSSQMRAIAGLMAGKTITAAAGDAGVNRSTVHAWLNEDFAFQAALNEARREAWQALQAKLRALGESAVVCLEKAVAEGDKQVAVRLVSGLGLLSGKPPAFGSESPARLAEAKALSDLWERVCAGL